MRSPKIKKINKPFPHYLVDSSKKIHGWFKSSKRECTSERFLLNPYNGCGVGCFYCYSRALPGYFQEWHHKGIIFVFNDFDKVVSRQLDRLNIGFCGYLSPVTEPFQEIDRYYKLSQKIMRVFLDRNLPVEFITKERIPQEVIDMIRVHPHCFGQVSILTSNPWLHKILVPRGAELKELFTNLERLSRNNIYAVCRLDPILPFINDKEEDLKRLLREAKNRGAKHIVASVLDLPFRISNFVFLKIKRLFGLHIYKKYRKLYSEKIGYLNADINYRLRIFEFLKSQTESLGLTFSLCMEYELKNGQANGLNKRFSSALNCEGLDVPIYIRKGNKFYPLPNCRGNCLTCEEALCGIEELAYRKSGKFLFLKFSDYLRFSRILC